MTPPALSRTPPPARPTLAAAVPFLTVALLGLGSVLLPPYVDGSGTMAALSVVGFMAVLSFLFVSVRRTSRTWVDPMPAFLFFGVLALARDASGGSDAGLAPLVALPILWLAMTGTRRDIAIAAVLTAAMFILPMLLVGAPDYPLGDWRRTLLWTSIAALVAPVVQRLVVQLARETRVAEEASAEVEGIFRGARLSSMIVFEVTGTIRSFSAGAEELLGHRADQVEGRRGPELFHDRTEMEEVAAELGVQPGFPVLAELAARQAPSRIWTFVRADGVPIFVQLVLTELRDHDDVVSGYLGVAIDVTAGVEAQQELAVSEGRWRVLLEHLPDATVLMVDETADDPGSWRRRGHAPGRRERRGSPAGRVLPAREHGGAEAPPRRRARR